MGRLLGRLDVPLDALGLAQASALAAAIGPVDRIIASPLRRAVETAEAWGLPIETDEQWLELDYGEYDGALMSDIDPETWDHWLNDVEFCPPGGESIAAVGARVRAACDALHAETRHSTVVVVTHVSPIKAAAAWALGIGDEAAWRMFVEPASVMRVGTGRAGPSLRAFNDTSHLVGLDPR